jgi:hypothetical protein
LEAVHSVQYDGKCTGVAMLLSVVFSCFDNICSVSYVAAMSHPMLFGEASKQTPQFHYGRFASVAIFIISFQFASFVIRSYNCDVIIIYNNSESDCLETWIGVITLDIQLQITLNLLSTDMRERERENTTLFYGSE